MFGYAVIYSLECFAHRLHVSTWTTYINLQVRVRYISILSFISEKATLLSTYPVPVNINTFATSELNSRRLSLIIWVDIIHRKKDQLKRNTVLGWCCTFVDVFCCFRQQCWIITHTMAFVCVSIFVHINKCTNWLQNWNLYMTYSLLYARCEFSCTYYEFRWHEMPTFTCASYSCFKTLICFLWNLSLLIPVFLLLICRRRCVMCIVCFVIVLLLFILLFCLFLFFFSL